jgi:hypothetical protein
MQSRLRQYQRCRAKPKHLLSVVEGGERHQLMNCRLRLVKSRKYHPMTMARRFGGRPRKSRPRRNNSHRICRQEGIE